MSAAFWLLIGVLLGALLSALGAWLSGRRSAGRQSSVRELVGPLADQLERVEGELSALELERRETRGRLEQQLRELHSSGERLRSETSALVGALRRPNTRGQWGQMQLRKVVELAGMVRYCDFDEQPPLGSPDGAVRPDLIVRLPGDRQVVIDAKAPLDGVLDAYQAADEQTRARHLQAHARLLRRHVKQLADKAYWSALPGTPDFVVMFLPGEHLYGVALEADPTLIEDAMAKRVLIATPTTLLALLHSVAYGWQQQRVADSAREVFELGRELHARIARLATLLAGLGRRLNGTLSAYNEAIGSFDARVLPAARRLAEHGAGGAGPEPTEPGQITAAARSPYPEQASL